MLEEYRYEESTRMSRPIIALFKGDRPIGSIIFEESDVHFIVDVKHMIMEWNERLKTDYRE